MDARDLERRRMKEAGMGNDYRSMFDRDHIGSWDLGGKDVVVTIRKVEAGTLTGSGGRKNKKPIVYFEGKERSLALNKTNAKTIAAMYGNDTDQWIGKRITIYPTTTTFGSETMDCIRVRPNPPRGAQKTSGAPRQEPSRPVESAPEREPGDDAAPDVAEGGAA